MKADAYAEQFVDIFEQLKAKGTKERDAFLDTEIIIAKRLVIEVKEIGDKRKASCDSAWDAIIKEQNQKWQAIVRKLKSMRFPFHVHPYFFQTVWDTLRFEAMANG